MLPTDASEKGEDVLLLCSTRRCCLDPTTGSVGDVDWLVKVKGDDVSPLLPWCLLPDDDKTWPIKNGGQQIY